MAPYSHGSFSPAFSSSPWYCYPFFLLTFKGWSPQGLIPGLFFLDTFFWALLVYICSSNFFAELHMHRTSCLQETFPWLTSPNILFLQESPYQQMVSTPYNWELSLPFALLHISNSSPSPVDFTVDLWIIWGLEPLTLHSVQNLSMICSWISLWVGRVL